ncbi:unnamed protein product [Rotaria magnacalcarata]|uniref:Uncharacterized protein n=3 Tax=Rotaria magnacalcarata TaxID=392030 RepID=A0A815ZGN4_9BILA|nr:unnamed protein product [Rotaria magnacalcarata]CAF3870334.1 unnamed protein product [Rotaria magnacalcarata]
MSIHRTAESALHALQELYNAIDISCQQKNSLSVNDSENLVHALFNLSQLINHINQQGMCGYTPRINTNLASKQYDRERINTFINPRLTKYDENSMMDSETNQSSLQSRQAYGECVLYHPIRIITTCADEPTVLHESDFVKHDKGKNHDHNKKPSRSGSRGSRRSHRSQRSIHGRRASQSRDYRSRSSRRSSRHSQSTTSENRRSHSRERSKLLHRIFAYYLIIDSIGSRSSQRQTRRSHASPRRSHSRRRSSHRRRSSNRQNQQYRHHEIPSRPVSNIGNPIVPSYPSNQMRSTPIDIQPSRQHLYSRSLPSSSQMTTASNGPILPSQMLTPTTPLPPPPALSALHNSHASSQVPNQQYHQLPISSTIHNTNTTMYKPITNLLNDQSSSVQQVPSSSTSTGNTAPQQQQQHPLLLSSNNSVLNNPIQNDVLSSGISTLPTTNNVFTSRSDNCPECRAITRLLQWAPLKCYDAAGIRRGLFLAGPKSEQLLKALYSSIKDASLSLDDIENCFCDDE